MVVATPDHAHAIIAKSAMQLKKHVYVQKPLTHSVHEARTLRALAKSTGVVTQMGNQGHSTNDARLINEWVQAGLIGPVREVHGLHQPADRVVAAGRSAAGPSGAVAADTTPSTADVYAPGAPKLQAGAPRMEPAARSTT